MKLHWSPFSPFVRKVMVVAHELGLAKIIHCVRTQVAATKPNPELMHENPLSKIPTLVLDDGTSIYDSPVICEYLELTAGRGPKLFPAVAGARIAALRRQALADGLVEFLVAWRVELARTPEQQSEEYLAGFPLRFQATLAALEKEADDLETSGYSIGHISIACALSYVDLRFSDQNWRGAHSRLSTWHANILMRPAFLATKAASDS
jgi:glutathione S-transferase